jgi:vitamin B12 transporter
MNKQSLNGRRTFAFRQWSRKPYAVFSSLKLLIKISVLSVAYTLVNPVQECKAQSDSTVVSKQLDLEEVEVSGQRAPEVYSQIARTVTVITKREVEQAPAQSINELLENIPQVDIRQRGTNGVQADISIQGGSFDQTLILLNGFNISDPQTGHHNLNLPINVQSIDRIEVLKGPASRVFGTNAFSGAVNFITGDNPNNEIRASLTAGDYGLYSGALSVNSKTGKLTNFISLSKSHSNGYINNTNYNQINAYYHGNIAFDKSKLHLIFGYNEKQFGANDFYSARFPDQQESTSTWFTGIKLETGAKIKFVPSAYWRRNYDHFKILVGSALSHNYHFSDVYGSNINTVIQNPLGKMAVGFDYRNEIIYSTNLGKPLTANDYIPVKGKEGVSYTKKDSRENFSLFLEQNYNNGNFAASAGVMANKNTKLKNIEFYPGIDMSYRVFGHSKWFTSVNRSLRLPTFTDLYYQGVQNVGNPDLKPETAWTFETGVKSNFTGIHTSISWFHRWGKDIIDWIWLENEQKWHTENWTTLNTDGIEALVQINNDLLPSAMQFVKNIQISYTFTNISKSTGEFNSYYALDNLKHKLHVGISHTILKKLSANWNISYQDRNGTYSKWDDVTRTTTESAYKAFWLLDAKLIYTYKFASVFAECSNILNADYIDLGNIEQPGRWFKAGFEIKL